MAKISGAMHVARIKSSHVDKAGRRRDYQSVYLRRSFREGPKVKHDQLANLSALPEAAITAIEAGAGRCHAGGCHRGGSVSNRRCRTGTSRRWPRRRARWACGLLGPPGRSRDLAYALIVSRVLAPGSKLSTLSLIPWMGDFERWSPGW